jgi:crotonobetainyl-CoA:carnitine CoA-transferase CaiB-like acyl-CoA transferase
MAPMDDNAQILPKTAADLGPASFNDQTRSAMRDLLDATGVDGSAAQVAFSGSEPNFDTSHQIVMAAAAVLGANAAAVADLWKMTGGENQNVDIDLVQAAASLHPAQYQTQNGHPMPALSLAREFKADFFPTADGRWFFPIGSYPHHRDAVLELLDSPNSPERLKAAVAGWNSAELEDAFAANKLPGAMVRTREEWLAHPQGRLLAARPVIEIEKIGDSAPELLAHHARPLHHLRVLDAAHVIAGPVAARTFAEHGADVLRISSPVQPDPIPQILDTGIGKRCAYLHLRDAADQDTLRGLCRQADVFVQSWRPGAMERLGFAAADLAAIRPGIIYVSISAYGADGPWAARGGFEQLGQVVSGIAHTETTNGKPRVVPTYLLNDYLTAYLAATGTIAALIRRAKEGGSYHVKVSLARTSMWVQSLGVRVRPAPGEFIKPGDINPRLETRESPFGTLEQLPPVPIFSKTPAYWSLPPAPLGSNKPIWR